MTEPVAKYDDSPFSSSKTSNWVARRGGLPPHVRAVARALMRKRGMDESHAIAVSINANKRWAGSGRVTARGGKPSQVTPRVRALSSAAVARWTAMKASTKHGAGGGGVRKASDLADELPPDPVLVRKAVDDNWDFIAAEFARAMTTPGEGLSCPPYLS
jgi:hypothetical protein